ncbi:MAG: hypothetical protein OXI54_00180 [Chloroflexota bacterium]|nr:hypothetical protein [Chloroflexota bacterium]MDE2682556.1 hypothetical protein [Chloroflexota bacterium]
MTEAIPFQDKLHTLTVEEFGEQYRSIIEAVFKQDGLAIIFDGDKPIVEITRYEEVHDPIRGSLKGKMEIHGDIVSPLPSEWYALRTDQDEEWYGPYTGQDEEQPA